MHGVQFFLMRIRGTHAYADENTEYDQRHAPCSRAHGRSHPAKRIPERTTLSPRCTLNSILAPASVSVQHGIEALPRSEARLFHGQKRQLVPDSYIIAALRALRDVLFDRVALL